MYFVAKFPQIHKNFNNKKAFQLFATFSRPGGGRVQGSRKWQVPHTPLKDKMTSVVKIRFLDCGKISQNTKHSNIVEQCTTV